jgi:hypothetical protein
MKLLFPVLLSAVFVGGCQQQSSAPRTAAPQATTSPTGEPLDDPPTTEFLNRAWLGISPANVRGTVLTFLPNRTLVIISCTGKSRVTGWGVAGEHIRWLEDGTIPNEAAIELPSGNELALRIPGASEERRYVEVTPPFVCQ